jgi:mono/diheme cytochrome c family protein
MRVLAALGVIGIGAVIAALIYFLGGFYNVAALEPDNKAVAWALGHVRQASVSRHAPERAPIDLNDQATIQAGARAFAARGCVTCHGAPGADWAKFSEGLRPDAADLNEVAKALPAGEIFWAIKNGINMTGMPSFARIGVDDAEIWKIAAFVKKLPGITPENYKSWASAGQ